MSELLQTTAARAARYMSDLDGRAVMPPPAAIARLAELGGPLPDAPSDPAAVVALLDRATAVPPLAAGPLRVTVPEALPPAVTDDGLNDNAVARAL